MTDDRVTSPWNIRVLEPPSGGDVREIHSHQEKHQSRVTPDVVSRIILDDLTRDEIIERYLETCEDLWYGKIPPGFLARFLTRIIGR